MTNKISGSIDGGFKNYKVTDKKPEKRSVKAPQEKEINSPKEAAIIEEDRFMSEQEHVGNREVGLHLAKSSPDLSGKQEIEEGRDEQLSSFVRNTTEPVVTEFKLGKSISKNDPNVFNIIHTNDMHGKLEPKRGRGGMAYVAGKIDQIRSEDKDFILVDAGDIAYAPPYSDRNRFNPIVDIMNDIGYDAVAAGNHEFQWEAPKYGGPDGNPNRELTDNMKELQEMTSFPIICANAVEKKSGKRPDFLKPYIIQKVGDVDVGVVGVVTKSLATSAHPLVGDGWKIQDQSTVLKEMIPKMKAEGADVIVVVSHDGLRNNKGLISDTPGIDIVVGGHDHQKVDKPIMVNDPDGRQVPLVEAGSHGYMVGKLRVEVDPETKRPTKVTSTLYPVLQKDVKPDPEIQKIVEKWADK